MDVSTTMMSRSTHTALPAASRATPQRRAAGRERGTSSARLSRRRVGCPAAFGPKLIASDVDGTLLNSNQELTKRVQSAVAEASARGVPLIVATGKARGPWAEKVLPNLGDPMPGVFLQGCLIYDENGQVIYSRDLDLEVCRDVMAYGAEHGLTVTAYCGQRIIANVLNEQTDRLLFYGEPTPEAVEPYDSIVGQISIQKMLFMAEPDRIDVIRPDIERMMEGRAAVTTAIAGMLEVLPLGASKGAGLQILLDMLGVAASDVLAIGDGENDVEMLEMVGLGVAVQNAGPKAQAAADVVVASNNEDGVAEAIQKFVLQPLDRSA